MLDSLINLGFFLVPHFRVHYLCADPVTQEVLPFWQFFRPMTQDGITLTSGEKLTKLNRCVHLKLLQLRWFGRTWINHCCTVGFRK